MLYVVIHRLHKSYRAVFDKGQGDNSCTTATLTATMHNITDRRTDIQQDYANSRSANNGKGTENIRWMPTTILSTLHLCPRTEMFL